MSQIYAFDLTIRPPRSPRLTLGRYVLLPRMLDKCRAIVAGTNGEFRFGASSMDRHFLSFTGIEEEALKTEVATGKSDSEMLAWVQANRTKPHELWEIDQWSAYQIHRAADSDAETLQFFAERVASFTTTREDIRTWFDLLDLDDYVTFGGQP